MGAVQQNRGVRPGLGGRTLNISLQRLDVRLGQELLQVRHDLLLLLPPSRCSVVRRSSVSGRARALDLGVVKRQKVRKTKDLPKPDEFSDSDLKKHEIKIL